MNFIISKMRQMCLLVAMLMMCSVSGRVSDNLREAAETEPTMDDNTNNVRRQETTVCGRRQIPTSKRDEGEGGSNDDDHSDDLDKLLGGSDVTYGQVPWHVNIYRDGSRICGGAIISEFWILTTATCLFGHGPGVLTLVVGDHNLSHHDEGQHSYRARRRVFHPSYEPTSDDYDIALIKVEPTNVSGITNGSGISFNNYVQPICLPAADESPVDNDNLTVSGWGNRYPPLDTQPSAILQTAVLPVINHDDCLEVYTSAILSDRMLCVGRLHRGNTDVCISDYGGPATFQSEDTHILSGIIIRGSACTPLIGPVLLTDVQLFRAWIDARINEFSNRRQRVIPPRAD